MLEKWKAVDSMHTYKRITLLQGDNLSRAMFRILWSPLAVRRRPHKETKEMHENGIKPSAKLPSTHGGPNTLRKLNAWEMEDGWLAACTYIIKRPSIFYFKTDKLLLCNPQTYSSSANLQLGEMTPTLCNHKWFTLESCDLGALLHFRHDVDPGVCVCVFFSLLLNIFGTREGYECYWIKLRKGTHVRCKILRNRRPAKRISEFEVNENPYIDGMKFLIHPETLNIHKDSEVNEYPYPRFETLHSPTIPHTHTWMPKTHHYLTMATQHPNCSWESTQSHASTCLPRYGIHYRKLREA